MADLITLHAQMYALAVQFSKNLHSVP